MSRACDDVTAGHATAPQARRGRSRAPLAYDYVTVGHVTIDVIEDAPGGPRCQPGGGAFYSALQAARLGLRALVVTQGEPQEIEQLLSPFSGELDIEVMATARTTTLASRLTGTARRQRVTAWAGAIERPLASALCSTSERRQGVGASIFHFAPVANEMTGRTQAAWADVARDAAFVGLTPQGLVRTWGDDGRMTSKPLDEAALPERIDAAVFNESERGSCAMLLRPDGPAANAIVAVTAGQQPIELRAGAAPSFTVAPVRPERVRDDLGAGDVFAAAFFVALARGGSTTEAARMGSAAAAVRMSADGPDAIGDTAAIVSRL